MFDFVKAVTTAIDVGKTFLTGGSSQGSLVDTVFDAGADVKTGSSGDGFLGLIKKGAQVYVGMQDSDDAPMFQTPEAPTFKARSTYRQQGRVGAGQTRYRPTNRLYQDAILRRMRQMNFEKNLERMTANTTVRPTTRRKAPDKPGTTNITRKMTAPVIKT